MLSGGAYRDAICSKLPNDPAQRLDCSQKTRAAQLECLERVLSETPLGPRRQKRLPRQPGRNRLPPPHCRKLPQSAFRLNNPARPVHLKNPIARRRPLSERTRRNCQRPRQCRPAAIRPDIRPKTADVPAQPTGANWVVSETTSPVDYSPLVTALIRSTSPVKDAPTTLAVRCREKHTELLVRTDGTWATTRGNELRVDYQINDQPAVRLPWIASADGKTASYKDDAVGLLQSLPEGAQLKINVFDGPGAGHDATFQLTGLDTVRKKIAAACNSRQ